MIVKKSILLVTLFLSGCGYNLDQKNIVDQFSETMCRTEYELQKIVGHTDCNGMAHFNCHIVVENYLPVARCTTPQTQFKEFFNPDTRAEDLQEKKSLDN